MATLFGRLKLDALAAEITTEEIQDKLEIVRRWRDDYHQGSLKSDKESSREQAYNQDFFMKILGYAEKPSKPYTFEPKATTLKRQLPDAVLGYTDVDADIENIFAVVELKGASIELDKPQRREGNMSPVQQAFKYKTQYRSCPFVIVSNFYEIRLYNDHQLDFEIWTLDDLLDPADDYFAFKSFYGLLRSEKLTAPAGKAPTELLLSEFRVDQERIGKKFYQQYKEVRLELLRDIYRRNQNLHTDFGVAIQLSQKIIDRVVFSCFAEDKGLLPEDILESVKREASASSIFSLWDSLKNFFAAVDAGSDKLGIPVGYNGGLFASDPVLDSLKIGDEVLIDILALGNYNFKEELSVNILGHIFEQSITDLQEIRQKVDGKHVPDALDELQAPNKRKSDGVFYTPDYIVRFIVDSTLGVYLRDIEASLMNKYGLSNKRTDETYEEAEAKVYREYQLALQTVHVLDPACGSGAFLVYALDYLLAENKRVAAILEGSTQGSPEISIFSDEGIIDRILRVNLYGVDLNAESVEITKLSLWLKTARPGQKLTSLDSSIKCGNSLIDDELVDPAAAFNYTKEFGEVLRGGGFNVIVGNPPYVSAMEMARSMPEAQRKFLKKNYETSAGPVDLYIYFFERGIKLLREGGKLGYISPNRYLSASYGAKLRNWLVESVHFETLIDYSDKVVFEDASTYPVITILENTKPAEGMLYELEAGKIDEDTKRPIVEKYSSALLSALDANILGFLLNDRIDITLKVFNQDVPLEQAGKVNATSTAGEAELYSGLIDESGAGHKIINTGTIDPYLSHWGVRRFKDKGRDRMEPYLDISNKLVSDGRRALYKAPKIIIAKIGLTCEAYYDGRGEFASINTNCIHSFTPDFKAEYVQAWLSSNLYNYVFECLFDGLRMNGGYLLYSAPNLKNTPIPKISLDDQEKFVALAETIAEMRREQSVVENRFKRFVLDEVAVATWPKSLSRWWDVAFFDFAKSLKHKGTLKQRESLSEYFDGYKVTVGGLVKQIDHAANQINQEFYKIHDLTQSEIDQVEVASIAW